MNNRFVRLLTTAFASAVVGFGAFILACQVAWRIFPYPAGANATQRQFVWAWHIFGEKVFQTFIVFPVLGFVAARLHHPNWKTGIFSAVLAGLLFQTIAISVYGVSANLSYNVFWETLADNCAMSGLFGFLAMWRQYRWERSENG